MKKSDLKKLIKPVVKECIHEVLLEEGLLSNVVAEVVKGVGQRPIVETQQSPPPTPPPIQTNTKLKEQRAKLMGALNKDAYNGVNLFEGTDPIASNEPIAGQADLGAPTDAGVDISSLVGDATQIWRAIK